MTDEQRRRIDDHRPAVGLQWDENNPPPRTPIERPEQWTILLTSGNHGLVGAYGHSFPHAEGDHERINVVDEAVVIKLRERIRELEAAGNTNKAVLTDEQIDSEIIKHGALEFDRPDQARSFARAIEATVLSNASKAVVAEPKRLSINESREYLVKFMEQHFTDKTFHRYIRGDATRASTLAGDFAWQMARALRMLQAAPAPANNPSTAGAEAIIDSVEFMELLCSFYEQCSCEDFNEEAYNADRRNLVKFISTRLAAPALNPSDDAPLHKDVEWLVEAADMARRNPELATTIRNNCKTGHSVALNPSDAAIALQTIADFPVTDLVANMDAWNMKNIAVRALKGAAAQSVDGGEDA